jgi:hypothetical protein
MRFTIRDLLWLMVVVGLSIAWWRMRLELKEEKEYGRLKSKQLHKLIEICEESRVIELGVRIVPHDKYIEVHPAPGDKGITQFWWQD